MVAVVSLDEQVAQQRRAASAAGKRSMGRGVDDDQESRWNQHDPRPRHQVVLLTEVGFAVDLGVCVASRR